MIHKKISLISDQGYGRKVPPKQIGLVLSAIEPAVQRSIRMAIQGQSTSRGGRIPHWLQQASDIRFIDITGRKQTILHFEAPMLGEAAPELFHQQELWPSIPHPEATGFDLLNNVLNEVILGNEDSDKFDRPLLATLGQFGHVLNGVYQELHFEGSESAGISDQIINKETVRSAKELRDQTPSPRKVRISGRLDMIRVSTKSFELALQKGDRVRGVFGAGAPEELSALLDQNVLIEGNAVYRPSGRVLRIDAECVEICATGQKIWEELPSPLGKKLEHSKLRIRQSPKSGVAAFFGTWPGNETDDELLEALERIN